MIDRIMYGCLGVCLLTLFGALWAIDIAAMWSGAWVGYALLPLVACFTLAVGILLRELVAR